MNDRKKIEEIRMQKNITVDETIETNTHSDYHIVDDRVHNRNTSEFAYSTFSTKNDIFDFIDNKTKKQKQEN